MRIARLLSFTGMAPVLVLGVGLAGCGQSAPEGCPSDGKESTLFVNEVPGDVAPEISSAVTTGRALESVTRQGAAFEEKVITIAKDPKLSDQWAKVVKVSGGTARDTAHTAGLAADLPQQANRLRAAGVANEEVVKAINAAVKAGLSGDEIAGTLAVTATAAEEKGPIDDMGTFLSLKITLGVRGEALAKAVQAEHQARGKKGARGDDGGKKATICHKPPGNPDNMHTLEVGASAVAAHLAHGDSEGPCPNDAAKGKPDDKVQPASAGKPDDKGAPAAKGNPDDKGKPNDKGNNGKAKGKSK